MWLNNTPTYAEKQSGFATWLVDGGLDELSKHDEVTVDALRNAERYLPDSRHKRVDWPAVWESAASRDVFAAHADNVRQLGPDLTRIGDPTIPPFGREPYWMADHAEVGGVAPTTVLAFLHYDHRLTLAASNSTPADVLALLANDPAPMIANAARMMQGGHRIARGL